MPTRNPFIMQYKISVLVFLRNPAGEFLMLQRKKAPNDGLWSPIGGKLEMANGESPHQCAVRETREETGMEVETEDLHLFCMAAEKAYEGNGHWLMFLFECRKPIIELPNSIEEGHFDFFSREDIDSLPIPATDREGLWSIYDKYHKDFVALRVDCHPSSELDWTIEQTVSGYQVKS